MWENGVKFPCRYVGLLIFSFIYYTKSSKSSHLGSYNYAVSFKNHLLCYYDKITNGLLFVLFNKPDIFWFRPVVQISNNNNEFIICQIIIKSDLYLKADLQHEKLLLFNFVLCRFSNK